MVGEGFSLWGDGAPGGGGGEAFTRGGGFSPTLIEHNKPTRVIKKIY